MISVSDLRDEWRAYTEYWDSFLKEEQLIKVPNASAINKLRMRIEGKKALMVFLFPPFSRPYRKMWRQFRAQGYDTGFLYLSPPEPTSKQAAELSLMNSARRLVKNVFRRFILISPDVWIICGDNFRVAQKNRLIEKPSAHIVHAHSFDFEKWRSSGHARQGSKKEAGQRIIVYVDQGFTSHPDRFLIASKDRMTFEGTYQPILQWLKHIEEKLDACVKVAAHPKASREETINTFVNFDVDSKTTIELIADADLVVTHSSTAIQWAVLLDKPIAIISTKELKCSRLGPTALAYAKELNAPVFNVPTNDQDVGHDIFIRDEKRYSEYVKNYMKGAQSPQIPLTEILLSTL